MNVEQLSDRAQQIIDAFSDALMSTAEAAAEQTKLATQVAMIRIRLAARSAVLESIAAHKRAVSESLDGLDDADPLRQLGEHQIRLLTEQEVSVLEDAGVNRPAAAAAIGAADSVAVKPHTRKRPAKKAG